MSDVQELGLEQISRVSEKVRKAVMDTFGMRGAEFLVRHGDIVTVILRETWIAIREELERGE